MGSSTIKELFMFYFRYTVFTAHPVLGSIMAVIALKNLEPGEEVLCDYGYKDEVVYKALGIK